MKTMYLFFLINFISILTIESRLVSRTGSKYEVDLECNQDLMKVSVKLKSIQLDNDCNNNNSSLNQTLLNSNKSQTLNTTSQIVNKFPNKFPNDISIHNLNKNLYFNKTNKQNASLPIFELSPKLFSNENTKKKHSQTKKSISKIISTPIELHSEKNKQKNCANSRKHKEFKYDIKMYIDKWQKIKHCEPKVQKLNQSSQFSFEIPLDNEAKLSCGIFRVRNKITDIIYYEHTIIIEYRNKENNEFVKKDALKIKCTMPKANFYQINQIYKWSNNQKSYSPFLSTFSSTSSFSTSSSPNLNKKSLKKEIDLFDVQSKNVKHINLKVIENFNSTIKTQNKFRAKRAFDFNNDQLNSSKNNLKDLPITNTSLFKNNFPASFNNDLPENFHESVEELIDYSGNYTASGPIPHLHISVRQNGQFINSSLNVHPGTPLEMIIYLDNISANVYGLLASYLKVTDNSSNKFRQQEEIIILDGCSIDQYIFGNFESQDNGKSILAKFRAFKFPESNYVLFVGTINVCINKCKPVTCNGYNHSFAYGRKRKRDLIDVYNHSLNLDSDLQFKQKETTKHLLNTNKPLKPDVNKVFEVQMSTMIKVTKERQNIDLIKNEFKLNLTKLNLKQNTNRQFKNIKKRFDLTHEKQIYLSAFKMPLSNAALNSKLTFFFRNIIYFPFILSFIKFN